MKLASWVGLVLLAGCVPFQVLTPENRGSGALELTADAPAVAVAGKPFQVRVRVMNVSRSVQTVSVWTCSHEQNWKTDNIRVQVPGSGCQDNSPNTVTLQPNEINEQIVELKASSTRTEEKFRVGFKSADNVKDKDKVYWSNPVIVRLMQTPTP